MSTFPLSADHTFPLSSVQEVVWLDQSLFPGTPIYNIGLAWQIQGEVDAALLAKAVNLVANGNDALRIVLSGRDGVARQRILPDVDVALALVDFSDHADPEASARAYMQSVFATPFGFDGGLLWSSQLVRVGSASCYWLQCYHHLVNDGFGAAVAMHTVAQAYNALLAGREPQASGPSYLDFLADDQAYNASPRFERDRQFWCERYATLPPPLLARSDTDARGAVAPSARVCWNMPRSFYATLSEFGAAHGSSIGQVMLAAIAAYFARTSGLEQIVIGVPVHNRGSARQKQTVGMFSSISPIGLHVDPAASFLDLLAEVAAELRRCYRHQRFPIAQINRTVKLAQAGRRQLYDVSFTTMNFDGDSMFGAAPTKIVPMHHSVERTPLVVSIRDHHAGDDVLVEFEYNCAVFERGQVERIQAGIACMLDAVLVDAGVPVALVPVMGALESDSVLRDFNATCAAMPSHQLVHQLFEAQAARRPEAIALSFEGADLSYADLNGQANRVAHALLSMGVKPDDRVAICVERGPRMLAGLLGIMKAGAGYVPLDPGFPAERLAYMLSDCAPAALLSEAALLDDAALAKALQAPGVARLLLDRDALGHLPLSNPEVPGLDGNSLAYVIYTSGSTGLPKGVMVEHGSVANFLASMSRAPGIAAHDALLAVTTLSFDIAGLELYLPLMNGARIVLASRATASDASLLAREIATSGATIMQATPATWRMLLAGGWSGAPGLKILCGGEALPADLAARLLGCARALWNVYGPTETTIWSTCRQVTDMAESIGRPIANTQVYILDSRLQPVPLGASGEIHIGGAGVARGYLNRPELTAERFLADPFAGAPDARMYKTGDVGRWLANGEIEYQGRNDFQVKVRGFRIELGEIEARLAACAGVREAVVMARADNAADPADLRLVAYLLAQEGCTLEAATLRAALLEHLADYMVPSAYVMLDAFPLTPNNKIDRKALPAPDQGALIVRQYVAPQGQFEEAISAVWCALLGLERVGREDDFFALGGHSLLAVQLTARLRQEMGIELGLRTLFDNPTLAAFARVAGDARRVFIAPIAHAARDAALPLSFAQQRLWFLDQLDHAAGAAYHMAGAFHLDGSLDVAALHSALDAVVARHENLRTTFHRTDEGAVQLIGPADCGFMLAQRDLGDLSGHEQDHALRMAASMEASAPFDLASGPLARGVLLRLGENRHVLLITKHHIISDGWSIAVMLREVSALYAVLTGGATAALAPLPIQFADYAAWQRSAPHAQQLRQQIDFWKQHLDGAPALLELPTDRTRPLVQDHTGATVRFTLPAPLSSQLRQLSQRHGVTLFMTLLAGWATLMARLSGQSDVVIGTPVANRQRAELEDLIGFFVNTLALRVRFDEQPSVAQLLAQVKASTLGAYENQDLPFDQVVEALQPPRSMAHGPLFQVMLSLNNAAGIDQLALNGVQVRALENPVPTTQFDLVLALTDKQREIDASLTYATGLFDATTIERMVAQLQVLLGAMVAADSVEVCTLPLLNAHERSVLIDQFNDSAVDYPRDGLVHQMFETQAAMRPDAPALLYRGYSISYAQLNARANRLAHHLLARGIKCDDRVAICLERGIDMIVSLLAVLKAGAGYVPLDPAYPQERLAFMLADSAPALLISGAAIVDALTPLDVPLLVIDEPAVVEEIAGRACTNPDPLTLGLNGRHLAYVIYTSGSTGLPKGVLNQHHSLCNLAQAQAAMFDVGVASRVLQFASFSFDASVFEMTMALCHGASFFLADADALLPGAALLATLGQNGITHATLPSSLVATMPEDARLSLTCLIMAGDVCPPALAARWSHKMAVFNAYGPTESTIWASAYRCDAAPCTSVPIGRPIANARLYILDACMNPVPMGVTGEIYIGGVGVARGYLNRPELDAERFLLDPFSKQEGARMYRSGDLGRWLVDGNVEYQGRNDFQVKIRGFRIELGEVEARLAACPGVREAAVVAREDRPGDKRLVAYLVAQDGVRLEVAHLRGKLAESLAAYMVPSAFVTLAALPLTPNGKLDRRALPVPDQAAVLARTYEAPCGELEQTVVRVWEALLGVEPVGRMDNFFELGGHSLMAVQVVARMRQELGVDLSLRTLFDHPVVADFAQAAGGARRQVMRAIGVADRAGTLPLSYEQQRLWFLDQFDPAAGAAYHIAGGLRMKGTLRASILKAALDRLVTRHENLRTSFASIDGQAVQVIAPAGAGFALREQDLRHLGGHEQQCALQRICADESGERFDLAAGPLVRGQLLRLADDEHVLLLTQHHIVSDGWSTAILVRELGALYGAFSQGQPDPHAPLAIQYADYAAWQRDWLRGEVLQAHCAFWQEHLGGAPALLELPTDRARPALQSHAGSHLRLVLPAPLAAGLRALAQRHGATLFMTILAGWSSLLARLSGQDDIVVGTPVANRGRTELESLIGFFVNTLALRVKPAAQLTVAQLLAQVKASTLGAYEHQDLPFDQVVEALQPVRSMSHSPLFQVMFSLNNTPGGTLLELPGLSIAPLEQASATSPYDLVLSLSEEGDLIAGGISYSSDLFDAATIERMAGQLQVLLGAMAADESLEVGALPLLSTSEHALLIEGFNQTCVDYPRDGLIHQLFEAQAQARPDAPALLYRDQSISYAQLNERANRLAHHLLAHGVACDDRVAICLERGIDMIVAVLAALKAGAGYVPLDPAYPKERLDFMLADSAPVLLLTDMAKAATLAASGIAVLALDADTQERAIAQRASGNPDARALGLGGHHLAYVIYTSGSTGLPKGVLNRHHSLCNLAQAQAAMFNVVPDSRVLQFASFSFDASVFEMTMALCHGASFFLADADALLAGEALLATLGGNGITHATLPSSLVATMPEDAQLSLACLIMAGDVCPPVLAARWARKMAVFNAYGPTESTIWASAYRCGPSECTSVPIGGPIANTRLYILDARKQPVPLGVTGEIYIGGVGVARGYLNRPDLDAERFLPDPFSQVAGARMYRSGDLGRWLADGNIEYQGRNDFQVKIRGFRIELGEVEARLAACDGVREAAVLAREDRPGDKRLVAYLVAQDGAQLAASELRTRLSTSLAAHMVPAAFVVLDAFPLTPNGKLDRRALPAPDQAAVAARAYEAPQGALETTIAAIWQDLLGLAQVGRRDDFFALGGHSLMAVQLVTRIQHQLGLALGLRDLFARPVLAEFAQAAQGAAPLALEAIASADRGAALPLSYEQQRLWVLDRLDRAAGAAYHIPAALRLRGSLDKDALRRALDRVVERHESLRTTFASIDGQPVQLICALEGGFALREQDLRHLSGHDQQLALARIGAAETGERFDLATGPLVRGQLLHLAQDEHVLLVTQHHIVSDGWSSAILVREVGALYGAFSQGLQDPLPALPIQYADYAAWQRDWLRGALLKEQCAFWQDHLAGAPALLALPSDRPRPASQSHAGSHLQFKLAAPLADGLRALAQRHGATLFMTLLAGWSSLLARLSGQDDIVVGTPVANRGRAELESLIGFFVNTLALRVKPAAQLSVAQLMAQVKASTLGAYEHQDLPFDQVVEVLQPVRSMSHSPVFQVMFSMNNTPGGTVLELPGIAITPLEQASSTTHYDLVLSMSEEGGAIAGCLSYASDLFDATTVERMLANLQVLLAGMAADDTQLVGTLPLLGAAERSALARFNDTAAPYPHDGLIHQV
ncbi:MAG: amino acid adenylation domain-containing protein, partial [Pseudomonadota bacterium]